MPQEQNIPIEIMPKEKLPTEIIPKAKCPTEIIPDANIPNTMCGNPMSNSRDSVACQRFKKPVISTLASPRYHAITRAIKGAQIKKAKVKKVVLNL